MRIAEIADSSQYAGYNREQASRKAQQLTKVAARTGQTIALLRHLALLGPIIERG